MEKSIWRKIIGWGLFILALWLLWPVIKFFVFTAIGIIILIVLVIALLLWL